MTDRQGIPSINDYAHYNEEAAAVWWAENRYDMEHQDDPSEREYDPWEGMEDEDE